MNKTIFGQIVVDFQSFKMSSRTLKTDSFALPNVKRLLSKNLTLIRRCEVNKFNLVIYFSLQEKCNSHLFMGRFSLKFLQRIKWK